MDMPIHRPPRRRFRQGRAPVSAGSLAEVRARIDAIDEALVGLIAERLHWVREATCFKADAEQVPAPERQQQVFERVRALARGRAAPPLAADDLEAVVDASFQALVAASIARQRRWFDDTEPADKPDTARGASDDNH